MAPTEVTTRTGPGGLTTAEAQRRRASDGPNTLPRAERPTLASRLLRELRDPMAVLLLAAAAISGVLLGEVLDATAIAVIVAVNAVIALVQEGRAERALEALEQLDTPTATVVRDGRRTVVPADDLVVGDLVVVQAGDRVPADLAVSAAQGLQVDEAVLTGESLPVAKTPAGIGGLDGEPLDGSHVPLGDRGGRLHRGTLVTRGAGEGEVVAIGTDTAIGAIAEQLDAVEREPTPLQRQLAGLTRRLGAAAILVATGTFALMAATSAGSGLEEAFLTAVALAVAAVPEGLAAVTTVALALGVGRMAERGAIVRRLPAVETLGTTDVLVIDKTGTVTENRMRLAGVLDVDGTAHDPDAVPEALWRRLEPALVLCNDATSDPPTGDPTEIALLDLTEADEVDALRVSHPRLGVAPFTSERRRMSVLADLEEGRLLLLKGAPEAVLPLCTGTTEGPLDESRRQYLVGLADERAARGERLLAVARRGVDGVPEELEPSEVDLELVALVALRDPPRASAPASVAAVRAAGVTLVMATGDHPATAAAIAGDVGVAREVPMTGTDLREAGMPDDPSERHVYARVDPDQKLELVTRLQERGHTVAMTGDGVNDAPALRRADIGVALGGTGSDVAREAADLVITDDDLATIVEAVREGRGIYDNLRKVIDYLVSSNLAEVTVVISTLLLVPAFGVPLLPLQLLWINLLTDGLPALALGVDPVAPGLMSSPPRAAGARLLDVAHLRRLSGRALVLAAGGMAAFLTAHLALDLPEAQARTVLFSTLVLTQVLFAWVVRVGPAGSPGPNRWLTTSAVVALGLHVLIVLVPAGQHVFDTAALPVEGWAAVLVGGIAPAAVLRLAARR